MKAKTQNILLVLFIWAGCSILYAAGPMLEPNIDTRVDFLYQIGVFDRPMSGEENEPDTADLLIPNNKMMVRLRKRFTKKDVLVLKYDIKEYTLRENSYKRYYDPFSYEFEHRCKIGAGYSLTKVLSPYIYYEYFFPMNNISNHSLISGSRIVLSNITMFEPTYAISLSAERIAHSVILRLHQVVTPTMSIMIKNSYSFAYIDTSTVRNNIFDCYTGFRLTPKTALHFGFRNNTNLSDIKSYTGWFQFGQQLPDNYTLFSRFRAYLKPENIYDSLGYNGYSLELRLLKKPVGDKDKLKNLALCFYNVFYYNSQKIKADVFGVELNYIIPKKQ